MRRYSHKFSPKVYTQHQLFACLVLKEALRLDYRGIAKLLSLPDPATIAFAPNTHDFIMRLFSALPHDRPVSVERRPWL